MCAASDPCCQVGGFDDDDDDDDACNNDYDCCLVTLQRTTMDAEIKVHHC